MENKTQNFMPKDIRGIPDIEIWRQLKEANKNMEIGKVKEWLEEKKEHMKESLTEHMKELQKISDLRMANKQLEALILQWRQILKDDVEMMGELPYRPAQEFLDQYDKHFNITTERHGRTS